MRHINFFSVPISIISQSGALAIITQWVMESEKRKANSSSRFPASPAGGTLHASRLRPKVVVTPNPEMIVAAQHDPEFMKALQSADLAIPDGVGVVAAVRLLSSRFTLHASRLHRISGLSLMEDLIALAARRGWRVMLLGGRPGIAQKAAAILIRKTQKTQRARTSEDSASQNIRDAGVPMLQSSDTSGSPSFPSVLNIVGLSGPQDILHASPRDLDHLITSINNIKPDLLFVAFGHGRQEKWLSANRHLLHVGVAMGVGGALDQIVDPTLRPPATIDSMGLGWLYRLVREPWRWRRQLALVKFTAMVLRVFVRSI